MNQNRAQRFPAALLAWLGLILGFSLGLFVDQAANLPFDSNLLPALRACHYCLQAALPVAVEAVKVNRWTLLGAIVGVLAGLVIAALPRLRPLPPAGPSRRLSSFRQAAELARFSRALSDELEVQPIVRQLHDEALRVTGALCGSTFLLDPESPEHRVALRVGEGVDLQRLSPMEAAVASAGHGSLVHDFEQEGEAPPHVGVRSALLVPITHDEITLGLIHLHSEQPGAFDGELYDFVHVLGAQAAVAIQNARRYAEQSRRSEGLRQRVNQLLQLAQIPNAVRIDRPLLANLNAIAQSMQETVDFSLVLISVFAPAGNQLVHTASAGLSPETFDGLQHLPLPWERLQPFLREENRSDRVYRVPHTQTADLYRALDLGRPQRAIPPSAPGQWHRDDLLLAPLYGSRGDIEGLLSVGTPLGARTPQSLVLEMLEIFAGQAALAIETAHLVTQAEQRVTEAQERAVQLGSLAEAGGVIATALRVDEVVTLSLDQLRRVIPYDAATFWQRELGDGQWRVLGARSNEDALERVIRRTQGAQSTLFSEIVMTRGVVYVADVSRDDRFTAEEPSTLRSWLGVPILASGAVLGLLSLEKSEDHFYSPTQVPLALSFANRVATALENARLYEESVRRAQELEQENAQRSQDVDLRSQRLALLNRIAIDLSQAHDLSALLQLTLETLGMALGVECASGLIYEGNAAREVAQILAAGHWPASAPSVPAALDLVSNPLLDRLQETGAPVMAEAESHPAESVVRPEHLAWIGPGVSAALFLPLIAAGRLLGAIGLGARGGPGGRKFTVADADLGRAIVQQTLTALQYLQLRERTQEQAEVQQLSRAIGRATDLGQLYHVVQLQLAELAGLHSVTLALYDAARDRVSFPLIVEAGQLVSPDAEVDGRPLGGLVGHIVRTRDTVRLSGDVAVQANALGLALGLPGQHPIRGGPQPESGPLARAYLGVPLLLGDQLVGALVAQELEHDSAFDERVERLLSASAGQIALALDNLRLFDQARQTLAASQERAAQFEALTEAAVTLASTLHSDEVIAAALDQLRRLVPNDIATFWLRGATPAHWRAAAVLGYADGAARTGQTRVIEPRTPLGEALALRRTQVVSDARQDARLAGSAGAWMGVPVVSQGEVVALIELEQALAGGFTQAQVPLAESLATRIAQALNNSEQFEASLSQKDILAEQARRQVILNQATAALSGLLDLGAALATALRLITEALSLDRAGLVVFDDDTSQPIRAACQPASVEASSTGLTASNLAANSLIERLRQADGVMTLDALSAERPVLPEQTAWVGGGIAAGLFSRLTFNGRTVGLLGAGQGQAGRAFTDAELSLAQDLCRFVAAAVSEAWQYETTQARLSEQALVNQISRALSQTLDLSQLLNSLRAQLEAWLGPARLSLALLDEERHEVSFPLAVSEGQTLSLRPQVPAGLLRHVLHSREPLLLPDRDSIDQELQGLEQLDNELAGTRAFLGVPLVLGDRVLGALTLSDPRRVPTFDRRHERILVTVASQIALVLDNRRLFEQTSQALAAAEERLTQLEALAAALSVIASTLYSEDVVGVTLEQFERVIPYNQAAFWRREAGAGPVRELRWRCADSRGYPVTADQLTQMLVTDVRQLALFAELASTRRIVMVADTAQDARWQPNPERPTRSWLGVPLVNKGEVIGLLIAEKVEPNTYHPSHAASAQILAGQITAVLTNTYQYEESVQRVLELDERSRRLAFLNRFAAELGGRLNLGSILQFTLRALAESLSVDQATVAVFDEARSAVLAMEHYPETPGARHLALPGSSLIERFQETPAPITVEDLAGPEAPARLRQADWIGQEVRAAMFLPLLSGGKLIGLIGLGQSMAGRRFTPGETELSMGLANLAAVAAQNALWYDRTQQRLAEQAGIHQITRALSKSLEPRALYANLREQIEAWVGADQIFLAANDESRNEVSFPLAEAAGQPLNIESRVATGLVRHLLQQLEPLRLNGEIAQHLQDLGIYDTGLGAPSGLDEAATWTSCLGVPLVHDEHILGALILANPKRAETFDESHERILSAVAAQVAASMSQARQFEQSRQITLATQTRAAQLSLLSTASSVIATARRSEQVIELALDQLKRLIPYDSAALWRREGPDGPWRLASVRGQAGPAVGPVGQVSDLATPEQDPLAEVASTRSSLVIADTGQDARFAGYERRPGSWLGFPLIYQGQPLGLIALEKSEPNSYSAAQASLALAFAEQAAVSLANVRQYEDSLRRAFELDQRSALLNRALARLSQAVEPRDVLAAALQYLAEALGTSQGVAVLFDAGRASARARSSARYPAGPDDENSLPPAANVLLDQLRASLAPLAASDVAADSLIQQAYAAWIGPDTRSALFLPLTVAGKLIGLVGIGHAGQRGPFTAAELELAMTVANQAAIAAQNARLYHETKRQQRELAAITQASRSISQNIDLTQVFETVRNQVEDNLHADSFYVALYDPAKNQVTYPVAVERGQTVGISPRAPDRLIAHILETRRSLLLTGDVAGQLADRGLLPAGSESDLLSVLRAKAYLVVPLISGSNLVGVLAALDFRHAFAFTDKHERGAATIAAPVAAAVESARLYEESAQRALALDARAALLGQLSAELGQATSLNAIVQFIAHMTAETLMADVGAALVLDEATDVLLPVASARFPDDLTGELPVFVPVGGPLLKQLQAALAPVTIDELTSEPQARAEVTAWLGKGVGAALFLPLIAANTLIGLVAVAQLGRQRHFTAAEVELAMALASQAALAAAHARLQEKMHPRLLELAAISRLCQAISRAISLPQLCDVLAAEIGGALEADTVVLALYDVASDALSFPLLCTGGQKLTASPRAPAGLLAHVLQKGSSLLLNGHVEALLDQLGLTYQSLHAGGSVPRSYLAVPLILGDQAIGVLAVEDPHQARRFNASHEFILNTVAGPIAFAVSHLRLQAQREARGSVLAEGHTIPEPGASSPETGQARRWPHGAASTLEGLAQMRPPVRLDLVLSQQLLIACHAVGAEAGVIYLWQAGTGRLASRGDHGLVNRLPAGVALEGGLVGVAAANRQPILVDNLTADPHWGPGPADGSVPPVNGTNGAASAGSNGHAPGDDRLGGAATTERGLPELSAPASNSHYRSALAVPLVAAEQVLGVVLFLSTRPAAFSAASLPVANAAASHVVFAIQAETQNQISWQQAENQERQMAKVAPHMAQTALAADVPTRPVPIPPLPSETNAPEPVVIEPARPPVAIVATATQLAAWRRRVLLAGPLLLVLCVASAALANGGALRQAASAWLEVTTPTATEAATQMVTVRPTLATPTLAHITSAPTTLPSATLASATTKPPTTATLPPTLTPQPSASPTVTLPPDVVGVATVVLPNDLVGRLRDAPNGLVIAGVPGNTLVHVLSGHQTTDDNIVWVHIRLPNTGQTGWISEALLKYRATPVP